MKRGCFAILVLTFTLAAAGPAEGTVTIGSNLATPPTDNMYCFSMIPCTETNLSLIAPNQAPGGLRSPVNGTVTSWRASATSAEDLRLRILAPGAGLNFTGSGTSAPATFSGVSPPIPTSLPISSGDAIGLGILNNNLVQGANPGATEIHWTVPDLADGATLAGTPGGAYEVLVQATIEPTNTLTFGKITRNKKKGTATLSVSVPNAGALSYSGKGVKVIGPASVAARGNITVTIKALGKVRKKLKSSGKAMVRPTITFTPTSGTSNAQPTTVKLKKKR